MWETFCYALHFSGNGKRILRRAEHIVQSAMVCLVGAVVTGKPRESQSKINMKDHQRRQLWPFLILLEKQGNLQNMYSYQLLGVRSTPPHGLRRPGQARRSVYLWCLSGNTHR